MLLSAGTIIALATGYGRAAVAIVRISGPETRFVLETISGIVPAPRMMTLRRLKDPRSAETLDHALVAWFPGPHSFTGEDMAELHLHGGPAVVKDVLQGLLALPECRLAEPGEFTRRAFIHGKMDLSEVEGLADLIDAETAAQRRQAMRQMEGRLAAVSERWRLQLIEALALVEADLDFSDEGDVSGDLVRQALAIAADIHGAITAELAAGRHGERLREGFTVVIAGPPNAGKSTLLNALARREAAIVSPIAGTTRDVIEVHCDLGGLPVVLVDTAGLRDTDDPIEREGVARARRRAEGADLVLLLSSSDAPAESAGGALAAPTLQVHTKADLATAGTRDAGDHTLSISAQTGAGLDALLAAIQQRATASVGAGDALITRERHRTAFTDTAAALARALVLGVDGPPELVAEDLRLAARALGRITGRVDVEDILDRIFASFCIGK